MADATRPDHDPAVENPHRDEPLPAPQEGMRPGVDPVVRPEQDEPLGPVAGLLKTVGAEVDEEASDIVGQEDPEAEALLASMGVEEEGIEGGQLLGLVAATLASVAALAVILIYLFYVPYKTQVDNRASSAVTNYEQRDLRAEATARLANYSRDGETYGLPIGRAMGIVAAEYAAEGASDLPRDRAEWNTLWPSWEAAPAVQEAAEGVTFEPAASALEAALDAPEEVGVNDEDDPTVRLIDNDDN